VLQDNAMPARIRPMKKYLENLLMGNKDNAFFEIGYRKKRTTQKLLKFLKIPEHPPRSDD